MALARLDRAAAEEDFRASGGRIAGAVVRDLVDGNVHRVRASVVVNAFGGRYFEPGPPRGYQAGITVRWDR